ncbi:hypothetical protein B0H19DRAFT_96020 [Mycena capillaripes]|nr:hypothetical protein B0H19DRAFT_96020 [Mycena capillaripes]
MPILLPFLPLGLSPSSSLVLVPMLFGLAVFFGLLAAVAGPTLAAVLALPHKIAHLLFRAFHRPTHTLLPTTAPGNPNANANGRSTANPPPPTTLRGRGRARSKPGRRLFGLGLGLGRRAKSLGPVLPRFNPSANTSATHNPGVGSAPASPGLRVPLLEGDADAVPLVDLSGSWASLSSFSEHSGSAHASGSGSARASISHDKPHDVLIDVSHPHPSESEYELVDVSVPPSPAAWSLAHPPLQPTPSHTAPTSPATAGFPISSFSAFPKSSPVPAIPIALSASSSSTPTPIPMPTPAEVPPPPPSTEAMNIHTLPLSHPRDSDQWQLPSPPLSPPRAPAFVASSAWEEDEEDVALLTARPAEASKSKGWAEWERETEWDVEGLAPAHEAGDAEAGWDVEMQMEEVQEVLAPESVFAPAPATELPLPSAQAIDVLVDAMHTLPSSASEDPATPVVDVESALPLPSAHAIDVLVDAMHTLPPSVPEPAPAYDALPSPVPMPLPLEDEETLITLVSDPLVSEQVESLEDEEVEPQQPLEEEEDSGELPLPSARAIDALVGGMHGAFPFPASVPASAPTYARTLETETEAPAYEEVQVQVPAYVRVEAVVPGARLFPTAVEDAEEEDGEEEEQAEDEDGSEHAWEGEVGPLDEVLEAVEGHVHADEEGDREEDPAELALPWVPLPVPVPIPVRDAWGAEEGAEEEAAEEEDDPALLALPPMPMPMPMPLARANSWPPPPPADDGDVEELVLDALPAEDESRVSWAAGQGEEEEESGYEDDVESGAASEEESESVSEVEANGVQEEEEEAGEEQEHESHPLLHIDTARLAPPHALPHADEEDADAREQDLASTLSTLSSTSEGVGREMEGVRVVLPSANATLLRPESRSTTKDEAHPLLDAQSQTAEADDDDDDDEGDLGLGLALVPHARPAWSRRAAAAPALGLPSSTRVSEQRDLHVHVPGAFPASASFAVTSFPIGASSEKPKDKALSTTDKDKDKATDAGSSTSTGVEKKPAAAGRARHRSPLDAALAMQLRPGLGVGADGAWLVRFLMSFFGWFAVLVARGREFD